MTNLVVFSSAKAFGDHHQALNPTTFSAWLAQAAPGEALEYHRGFLCHDRGRPGPAPKSRRSQALNLLADHVYDLAERGFVHLVQRRIDTDTFSYLAIARPTPQGKALDFSTLMTEEAA